MAEVHGSCDERFAGVRDAPAEHLDADEVGASVAVDLDGETVVDLWGGPRDAERTTPWTQDRRLTISYMMNRMAPGILGSPRSEAYVSAVYEAVS